MPVLNPHLHTPLSVFDAPAGNARLAAILVHGRGQSPALMRELLVDRLDCPQVAWFAPLAAENTWYPERFIAPLEANEPRLSQALARIEVLSEALLAMGFPYTAQVLVGFSQGACLCSEFLWRQRRRYAGLIALTGGLIGPRARRASARGRGWQACRCCCRHGTRIRMCLPTACASRRSGSVPPAPTSASGSSRAPSTASATAKSLTPITSWPLACQTPVERQGALRHATLYP
ncbi:alpha/beta hydrolase [Cupriavidus taiwanensis]|uniref:alpha/beta hydrolase n=1 Tax=Cupriavidus taiwanensis TaxID=164546 RepID=UPI001F012496|nr:alpha/beta hydrolase [Cupriavidus taiwanensis]